MDNAIKYIGCLLVGLCLGFGIGYISQPEPRVAITATLKPPFVEVRINGKLYDAGHLKLVPEPAPKKGWWGDNPPAAKADCPCGDGCKCADCKCNEVNGLVMLQPPVNDRGGDRDQASLFSGVLKEIFAWLQPKYDDAARVLAERERSLAEKSQWIGAGAVVALLMIALPIWSIALSQGKLAGKKNAAEILD